MSGNLWLSFGYTLLLGLLGSHNTPGTLLRSIHVLPEVKKAKSVRGFSIIKTSDKENNSTPAGRHLSWKTLKRCPLKKKIKVIYPLVLSMPLPGFLKKRLEIGVYEVIIWREHHGFYS